MLRLIADSTYALNRSAIFFARWPLCILCIYIYLFINDYSVPSLSYYILILLIDPHKQLLFAAGREPAQFDP